MHIVQGRADDDQFEEYARHLAALLRGIIERRSVSDDEKPPLESLRDLFAEVGEATLSRAGELSLPQKRIGRRRGRRSRPSRRKRSSLNRRSPKRVRGARAQDGRRGTRFLDLIDSALDALLQRVESAETMSAAASDEQEHRAATRFARGWTMT